MISHEEYQEASAQLKRFKDLIKPHTICFAIDGRYFGTAVLIEYNAKKMFLSAHHVLKKMENAQHVAIIQKFDNSLADYPSILSEQLEIIYWDLEFKTEMLRNTDFKFAGKVKDLAIILPNESMLSLIRDDKLFYPITAINNVSIDSKDCLVAMGIIKYDQDRFNTGPFGMVVNDFSYSFQKVDYIVCSVLNNTYQIKTLGMYNIQSIGGLSGGGLWKIIKNKDGIEIKLVGITIAERLENGSGDAIFHGPKSISSFLQELS